MLASMLHGYTRLQPRAVVYVRPCCLGRNARNVGPRCRPCGDAELARPANCTENSAPGAVRLAQLLTSHISRMELIQLGGNKNEFMFHSGGSPQEFWNFLQLGLWESRVTISSSV